MMTPEPTVAPLMILQKGTVAYTTAHDTCALSQVSLTLGAGHFLGVIGASGSGKSTLAQVVAGLLPLSSGSITYAPSCIKAIVMQQPGQQLIGDTLREDLWFGMDNFDIPTFARPARIAEVLTQVGLDKQADRPVVTLSGGQQQLGAIAGCLAIGANLLIFDEATSMLDAQARDHILAVVRSLCETGIAILWITHRLDELAFADAVIVLADSHPVYHGSVRDFWYGDAGQASPCEDLGFALPYVPQVVCELATRGIVLCDRPTTAAELAAALLRYQSGSGLASEAVHP